MKDPASVLVNVAVAGLVNTGAACAKLNRANPKPRNRATPDVHAREVILDGEKGEEFINYSNIINGR